MNKIYASWRDYPMDQWRWKSFSPQEMACRGTGKLLIVPSAMDKLQALRDRLGKPMVVNSAYRSPEHNQAVGGAAGSKHLEGLAYDVRMENHNPAEYIAAAIAVGFTAIGTYPQQNFVHADARGSVARWGEAFPVQEATPGFTREEPKPQTDKRLPVVGAVAGVAVVASLWGDVACRLPVWLSDFLNLTCGG
jgi:zinc D-Ala-D-Ala carboxypeptidase